MLQEKWYVQWNTGRKTLLHNNLFKTAIDQFPVALITDEKGCYQYVSPGWCRYMGYEPEQVYGKPVRDIMPDTRVDEALRSGKPIMGYRVKDKNGNVLFNHCFPLFEGEILIGTVVLTFFYNLEDAVQFSEEIALLTDQVDYYQKELKKLRGSRHSIDEIVGSSAGILDLKEKIRHAAQTTSTVLIEGETGCGKELVANAIHDLSQRGEKPFIKINCAAIPADLVESELFGYEGGAFTGADRKGKRGLFESADTGSLFLDEIHQMPYFIQPKLLRALQEREVQRVGGRNSISFDTRIIAATNQSLERLVAEERFREDLYYRLNVISIRIPPLRERTEDIPELMESLRKRLNRDLGLHVDGFTAEVEERLMAYSWPGNVRELSNVLERAFNMQLNGVLSWDCFQEYFERRSAGHNKQIQPLAFEKKELEKKMIADCLAKNRFNKTKTAAELGISRTMLYQKLKQHEID